MNSTKHMDSLETSYIETIDSLSFEALSIDLLVTVVICTIGCVWVTKCKNLLSTMWRETALIIGVTSLASFLFYLQLRKRVSYFLGLDNDYWILAIICIFIIWYWHVDFLNLFIENKENIKKHNKALKLDSAKKRRAP